MQRSFRAKVQHYPTRMMSAEQRMKGVIDGLQRLSGPERTYENTSRSNLHDVVLDIIEELRSRRAHREVKVTVAQLPRIHRDPVLIRQPFEDLLTYAFKFTRGRPFARVHVGYFADNREVVHHVRNNGAGSDVRYADRLFGLFERLHHADEFEGAEVGLALVERIVERHGGRVCPKPPTISVRHCTSRSE